MEKATFPNSQNDLIGKVEKTTFPIRSYFLHQVQKVLSLLSKKETVSFKSNVKDLLYVNGGSHSQADHLREKTLQQMHTILTTRQSARALLAINDYFSRLRALSTLWLARPQE